MLFLNTAEQSLHLNLFVRVCGAPAPRGKKLAP